MLKCQYARVSRGLLWIAVIFFLGSSMFHRPPEKRRYQILEGSKMYLAGTSNVNSFTCDCEDQYFGRVAEMDRNGGYVRFRNVELQLRSKNFDCHNRKIDNDMQKALKADYFPYIKISLSDTWQEPKCLDGQCKDWFDVQANVNITITNVTKKISIPAKAKMLGPNSFQLRGQSALQMSAFGIDPPQALMGMIKVNDWITFHFDLMVSIDELQ